MNNLIDVIISKRVSGQELSASEKILFDGWLRESKENRKTFLQMKMAFNQTDQSVLDQYRKEIWSEIGASPVKETKTRYWDVLRWAAVFVLISVIVFQLLDVDKGPMEQTASITYIEKFSLSGQKITTVLPDGTTVKLNSDSRLIVPSQFQDDVREVELIGEAFFDVERDESRPFIIKTNDLNIQVLGTSFNISAYDSDQHNSVSVRSGKVRVESNYSKHSVDLVLNQMVAVDTEGQLSKIRAFDSEVAFGWMDKKLVFKNAPLEEVLRKTERWFDIEIDIDQSVIPKGEFTGTFVNSTAKEVLISLTKAYNLRYSINENEVEIY